MPTRLARPGKSAVKLVMKRGCKLSSAIVLESDEATKSLGKGNNTRDKYSECWHRSLTKLLRKMSDVMELEGA
jgi:hypothetical protein